MRTPDHPRDRFVCLHDGPSGAEWFAEQILALGASVVEAQHTLDLADAESVDAWVDHAVNALERVDGAVHVVATGAAAYGALTLQVRRPDLVRSLLLGDPTGPADSPDHRALLAAVTAPTLVIASAPDDLDNAISADAQQIAGLVDNGVFVVIDGCAVPAHRERGSSFDEWALSFAGIAEGLADLHTAQQEEAHV
ncbi:hypothetical protein AAFP35_23095 [Gordonia sp. CPCC 206044]|uniref:alpha/beta fold hydrolase n=1 Tax=Gordonia sp. CPCC 206044 TaxID=3140793 RepID=UPI003AF40904